MTAKRWVIAPSVSPEHLRQYKNINPILAQVLFNRGFEDPQEAYRFLYVRDLPVVSKNVIGNPFEMKDMAKAVERILKGIQNREEIVVYGDFDADGVTSTTLMMQVLEALGAEAKPYIPHRIDEGYGLNTPALKKLAKSGVKLVITVDCGIRSAQEVEDGNAAGLDIVITDHHSIGPEIPNALAVINPQQEDCPGDTRLAGVGVAFMVAQALLIEKMNQHGKNGFPSIRLSDLLDLVAIGTVADIMPLNSMLNRVLVRHGLSTLNELRRPGIRALMAVAGIKAGTLNAMGIGFGLGPRINAAGRLGNAMTAYHLLSATDDAKARQYANELQQLNVQRQEFTRAAQSLIREQLSDDVGGDELLIFAGDSSFQPGIVGLVAGRLTEEFYRPAVVMEMGETESRASCRSIPEFNITHALDECADLLVRHGGHAMAAGFTVLNENIDPLKERLTEKARASLEGETLFRTIDIDVEINIHRLSEQLVDDIQMLEPTGHSNQAPTFMTRSARVSECRTVGNDDRHLKLKFSRAGQPPLDAIGFGLGHWAYEMSDYVDVVYRLEMNEWNGRRNLQMNMLDIRLSDGESS